MSMLFMTKELEKELYPTYTVGDTVKEDKTRLMRIKRQTPNFFFALDKMPKDEEITLLEPFQDLDDIYNEFRGIFIKPLMCGYLAARHTLALSLEFTMLAINLLTFSKDNIEESALNVFIEAMYTFGYLVNSVITEATTIPIFLLRLAATVVNSVLHLATPSASYASFYETPVVDALVSAPLMAKVVNDEELKDDEEATLTFGS